MRLRFPGQQKKCPEGFVNPTEITLLPCDTKRRRGDRNQKKKNLMCRKRTVYIDTAVKQIEMQTVSAMIFQYCQPTPTRRQGQPRDLQRDPGEVYRPRRCLYVECVLSITPGIPLPINLPGSSRYSPFPHSCPTCHLNTDSIPRHFAEVLFLSFVSQLEVWDRRALGTVMKSKVFLQALRCTLSFWT